MNEMLKCCECVYYPSNCSYLNKVQNDFDGKVLSILYRFMQNGCKYFIWRSPLEGGEDMHKSKGVRCIDCQHYPHDCGYWQKGRRDKGGNAVPWPDPYRVHACKDYTHKKGDEKQDE